MAASATSNPPGERHPVPTEVQRSLTLRTSPRLWRRVSHETISRDLLTVALWDDAAAVTESTVISLVSKLRRVVTVRGGQLRVELPADACVDIEAARDAMHRAESAA